ncbi:hypothetical protein H2248_005920 [Termitomyces sp. 'cryptogamus']|nr:hypothetical protein H2248_005920 [Termitomyces sp. 'cryptogamus']
MSALPPNRSPRRRPTDLFSTSAEELALTSPPYRPMASTSNLHEDLPPSPAYYPSANHPVPVEEKRRSLSVETDARKPRPTVHYEKYANVKAPVYTRENTLDLISSRASIMTTDDEESEDYDWSGEDDLVEEETKFEGRMGGSKPKAKGWGIKRVITVLFSSIIGSTFFAVILVVPGVLVQIYWYKPNPTEHRLYVKDNVQSWLFWAAANLVISWYLAMIVDVVPVIAQYFLDVAWGYVSEYVKTRIEIYDSLKNDVKPLLYAASVWVSWTIIFQDIYHLYDGANPSQSRARYTERLEQVIQFIFFFALVICVKQLLSHTIAFLFHRTAYKDRITSVQEALEVIDTLRQYRPKKKSSGTRTPILGNISSPSQIFHDTVHSPTPPGTPPMVHSKLRHSFILEDGADADNEDADRTLVHSSGKKGKKKEHFSWLSKGHKNGKTHARQNTQLSDLHDSEHEMETLPFHSRPATPSGQSSSNNNSPHRYPPSPSGADTHGTTESVTLAQAAQVLKNAVLHDARNLKGKNIGEGSMAWNVSSTQEAKRLARSIYMRFKDRGRIYLLPSDFYPAFPDEETAKTAFRVFDKDNNGDISRAEIKTCLVRVYKERRFLSRSMRDVGAALRTLDKILLLFAMIILFFISLSVFGVNISSSLSSVYSLALAASFVFKGTASSAFDAIMFLFVTHPFDTGDRCFIDQEILVVKKVGLFATVFARSDGSETYYFNSQLFNKFITNVRRSGDMFESLTMQVAWRTPFEKLDALEHLMNEWLSTEENRWYQPSTSVVIQHIEFQRYLTITLGIGHNGCAYHILFLFLFN